MSQKEVAILDIGSKSITVLVGSQDVNKTISIRGSYSENYEGFADGELLEPSKFERAIIEAVAGAERITGCKIKKIMVGIPTEFCFCVCKNVCQNFGKPKRITNRDVENLFSAVKLEYKTHTVISRDAVYYVLGENNRVSDPVGLVDYKITACLSFVLASNKFLGQISKALIKTNVEKFGFVSSAYTQALYLFDEAERDKYVLFVDCGYITTTVALVRGRGVLCLSSFSMGGGYISADLARCLRIPFSSAECLNRKIVLCIKPEENDNYDIVIDGAVTPVSMRVANAIVESRVEVIAKGILKCFESWQYNFPDFIPLYLTGGGLSFIKGAKDVIAKNIGKNVLIAQMPYSGLNKPNNSSSMSVLNYALSQGK